MASCFLEFPSFPCCPQSALRHGRARRQHKVPFNGIRSPALWVSRPTVGSPGRVLWWVAVYQMWPPRTPPGDLLGCAPPATRSRLWRGPGAVRLQLCGLHHHETIGLSVTAGPVLCKHELTQPDYARPGQPSQTLSQGGFVC